jgi:hypothetical protein
MKIAERKYDALELLIQAQEAAFDEDVEELQTEPQLLEDLEQELALRDLITNFPLSNEIRIICEQEMREAKRRGWRLLT